MSETTELYHPELKCHVRSIGYDYTTRTGTVEICESENCDATGVIAFFEKLDSQVQVIQTYVGQFRDTSYRKVNDGWMVFTPLDYAHRS